MLTIIRDRIQAMIKKGMTLEHSAALRRQMAHERLDEIEHPL